jgi:hypothetical protein
MRLFLLTHLLLFICLCANASDVARPQGKNCTLPAPPETAGEAFNHGLVMRIHPRASGIDSSYTGCQVMWAPNGRQWVTVSVVAIENGDPVRIWWPDSSQPELMACRYKNGRVVAGNPESCAAPQFLIAKSVAPGCTDKLRAAITAGGVTAPPPQGCNHE